MGRLASQPWWPSFVAERDALLHDRLKWCAIFTVVCGVGMGLTAFLLGAANLSQHVNAALSFASVGLILWGSCALPSARGWATALGMTFLVVLTLVISGVMRRIPEEATVIPATLVSVMLGTTLLLPWGAWRQSSVAVASICAYVWTSQGPHVDAPTLCLILSTAGVAVVGARLVEQLMTTSFQRTWVQERLVSLARALAEHVEVRDIVSSLAEHGQQVIRTTAFSVSLHNPARRTLQVVLTTGPNADFTGFEMPDDVEPVQRLVARPIVILPADDPTNPINAVLAHHGAKHALYAMLRQAGQFIGVISFARHDHEPFSAGDIVAARAIAEQAALAVRTGRLVDDLRHANTLKTEFVSTMSHELRTPLNVILGFAEMLDDPSCEGEQRQAFVERIRGAGRDLLELIENTLAVGRLEAGRDQLDVEDVPLPLFWQQLGERCARMPRAERVELRWQQECTNVQLRTDPRKLQMIVSNLVSNALKFTEQGYVTAAVDLVGDHVEVHVTDTGIGIPEDAHTHIFEMFRQADSSDSRRYGGTGLGLYIVRRFVERLGGTVTLRSAPGEGSTFAVRLPIVAEGAPLRTAA